MEQQLEMLSILAHAMKTGKERDAKSLSAVKLLVITAEIMDIVKSLVIASASQVGLARDAIKRRINVHFVPRAKAIACNVTIVAHV